MASRILNLSLFTTKQITSSVLFRCYTSFPFNTGTSSLSSLSNFSLFRLRPLVAAAAAAAANLHRVSPTSTTIRGFATHQTTSSLNDSSPNWSNRPPKETILLDGCDFEHWLVVMEKPEGDPTRDEIIDSYIKTLAMVLGSEEEARMKIYSLSTRCYFAFGALVSEELSYKIKELPRVQSVLPDSYLDVKNKDYGGEPFINGQAVPYDPKYQEEWIRKNARASERNGQNDRPPNFDRSRNLERRRENMQNRLSSRLNMGGVTPSNVVPNMGRVPPGSMAVPSKSNVGAASNSGGMQSKICIVIRSFDQPFLNNHYLGLPPYTRKIGLPESRVLYTVLRSPHIDKKSREQFEMRIKKQFLVMKTDAREMRKKFFWLKRLRIFGAQYEIKLSCKTRLDKEKLQRLL